MVIKNLCSKCGADRDALLEMLLEQDILKASLETENHAIARIIIGNCNSCRQDLVSKMKERK